MTASRKIAWPTLALLCLMYALLVGNVVLFFSDRGPLVLHVLASAIGIHLAFTIWHDAVHRSVFRQGRLDDVVGVLGVFPYMAPYFLEKWFHLQHHALLNQRTDPNFIYTDGSFWTIPLRYLRILRYAKDRLPEDPRSAGERMVDRLVPLSVLVIYAVAWWHGAFFDLALIWFVPLVMSKLVMDWYINYLPHVGLPPDRYRGTRVVDVPWLSPLVLFHNYHAIHHLWPQIPWYEYRATFRRKADDLRERGVPITTRVAGYRRIAAAAPVEANP